MWTLLSTPLLALLFLSHPAAAQYQKRTVTINACESKATIAARSSNQFLENANEPIVSSAMPTVVLSTVTVIPMPIGTFGGVTYSGVSTSTDIPAGIFYPGAASGSAFPSGVFWSGYSTGSGSPHPTGGNRTHHHTKNSTASSSTSSALPLFSVLDTSSIPTPTSTPSSSTKKAQTTQVPTTFSSILPKASPTSVATPTLKSSSSFSSLLNTPAAAGTKIPFLRGVNLGGWLVLEKWMDSSHAFTGAFADAVDQYAFDSISGASSALEAHWSTYFTESDIQSLAATGLNALRIPIGYWAYNNSGTPYLTGADAYLDQAITWARAAGMYVWVDCHGSPGSQNGFDNSGHAGSVEWQTTSNLAASISVLETMAKKYGSMKYADVVVGLEMTNEPISYGNNKFSTTQSWAQQAYTAVKAVVENPNLVVIMHDAFQGAEAWVDVGKDLIGDGEKTFGIDIHLYQLYTDADNALIQVEHISKACGWATDLETGNAAIPTYVGEFSAATNICVNPDGTTTAGTTCSVSGCQCQSGDFDDLNDAMVKQMRMFVEAQLDVFESSSSGYFMWAAKGPGGWGFFNGIEKGVIPNPVTSRKYSAQCSGLSKRRDAKSSFGRRSWFW